MRNWKDFDWTDLDGNTLPPEYNFAAVDSNGGCYAYEFDRSIITDDAWLESSGIGYFCGNFQVENWKEALILRDDKKESAFTEENFLEFIHLTGYDTPTITSIIEEFKRFLESRKQLPKEITDAMAILEKNGYKVTKD